MKQTIATAMALEPDCCDSFHPLTLKLTRSLNQSIVLLRALVWEGMCKVGVRSLPMGMTAAAQAIHVPRPGFDYNPLVWGHVNERLPYFLFGHEVTSLSHQAHPPTWLIGRGPRCPQLEGHHTQLEVLPSI